MGKGRFVLIGSVTIFLVITGCAGPSRLKMDYGTSFELAKLNQILDPGAEKNLEPATGLDGRAARAVIERYRTDFEKPTPPPTYVLGAGAIGK